MRYDYLIVGAGFAGCTLAERFASANRQRVLLVEKRDHIGGNAYDHFNEAGILVQRYGPHIFHTRDEEVWNYLSRFTTWNDYVHRVIAIVRGKEIYLPINLESMEKLYERTFTSDQLRDYFARVRVPVDEIRNSRDAVVSKVGEELYDLFFKNYTRKQWGVYPDELEPGVTGRLPIRFDRDTRYFADPWQGIPTHGYTSMFEAMLHNPNIEILLNTDYREILHRTQFDSLIYTGPIDYFFNYQYGTLPYRSLHFTNHTLRLSQFQNAAVVNYPNDHDYTRITEFKHFYKQIHTHTSICYEFPSDDGDPYYPIPKHDCIAIYRAYKRLAEQLSRTYFVGRLANYRYINMDQVVREALTLYERLTHDA